MQATLLLTVSAAAVGAEAGAAGFAGDAVHGERSAAGWAAEPSPLSVAKRRALKTSQVSSPSFAAPPPPGEGPGHGE